jgi:hypothetical protein
MFDSRWSLVVGAAVLAVLCGCSASVQERAAADAERRGPLTPQQLNAVYREAYFTQDGFVYTVEFARLASCAEAEKLAAQLATPPNHLRPLRQVTQALRYTDRYLFAMEPELRAQVRIMNPRERTGALRLASGGCMVAELIDRKMQAMPPIEPLRATLQQLVDRGWLPHPDALDKDPQLRMRTLANTVRTLDAARNVPPGFDFNTRMSNDDTILTFALLTSRVDLVREALKRGANPNLCGPKFCPLQLALYMPDPAQASETFDLLLRSGADPNQLDLARHARLLPLAVAIGKGRPYLERLVKAGAKVNGVPQASPPLFFAAAAADQGSVEYLLAQGADIFIRDETRSGPPVTLFGAAQQSENPQFIAWVEKRMMEAAAKSGQYKAETWIEQGGKRINAARGEIRLKAASFRIVTRLPNGARGVIVASAQSPAFQEDVRSHNRASAIFRPAAVGAEANDGTSDWLYVLAPSAPTKDGVIQAWYWDRDDQRRFSGRRQAGNASEFSKDVRKILLDRDGKKTEEIALADYRGGDVYLVVAVPLYLSVSAQRFIEPQFLRLRFQ